MSESLTLEKLDELNVQWAEHGKVGIQDTWALISMARRSLQLEERLGKAISAIRLQQRNWDEELVRLEILRETGGPKEAWVKACRGQCQRAVDDLLDSPEGLRPPVPVTPPVEPDALPVQLQTCKHGTPFRYACDACDDEATKDLVP